MKEGKENKECLEFDEFYPKKIKRKGKRTYKKAFGDDNEIKEFFGNLERPLNSKNFINP